ncbi:aminotransferase class I/II-fold pyridoxal phosphate-dependent enzyme [Phytohalomonas tamaricis]|uniref:aminotransferase class I/II-fold pyridoxal phosphate-dependent enzyme n=1 Tax=Phytohalomonas tamaricis TaxID=2081032 RepID=UPI000D0ACB7A|nr:aminotransferase class I/II-fold pyridoxal phosphate-dependent enzyme [Phytohalomonas tamaricis]
MAYSARLSDIRPFQVMDLLEQAQALENNGHDIIHLEIGEPDFPCPAPIVAAGRRALDKGETRYTPATGITSLKEAIAGHYASAFDVEVDPRRIIITPGASGALLLAAMLLAEQDSRILMADPTYPCNRHFMALMGARVDPVIVGPDSSWQLDDGLVARHWRDDTRVAMLATPSNPTGHVLEGDALARIAHAVRERSGYLLVDEIYQGLTYDVEPITTLSVASDAFVVNSFSKYFGMTGWRLGWLVAPDDAVEPVSRLAQNVFLAASTLSQHAALAAFSPECLDELEHRRHELRRRRDTLLAGLKPLRLVPEVIPEGAFYLWLDISCYTDDSKAFCQRLLDEEGVAITPGSDFALQDGNRYVRIAFTTNQARLEEAIARLSRFLARQESKH